MTNIRENGLKCAALILGCALAAAGPISADAALVSNTIGLSGSFSAGMSGTGTAVLTGASGQFKQWIGVGPFGSHTNISVTAGAQNVGLNVSSVGQTNFTAGSPTDANLTYNNVQPGTPSLVNSFQADMNGSTNIATNFQTVPNHLQVQIGGLITARLVLNFNGAISDLDFVSSGPSNTAGAVYDMPGTYTAMMSGTVTGTLTNLPLGLGNINLGTLYTLAATPISVAGNLGGTVALTDTSAGNGPWPADMLANFSASLGNVSFPVALPLALNYSASVANGSSGLSSLVINPGSVLNANFTLTNVSYNLNGSVADALVPEPSSLIISGIGLLGLVLTTFRARRRAD